MSNFNGQPNQLQQNNAHVNASGAMLMSGTQNSSLVSGSYSMSSQSSLNVVGQMSLVSSMGQGVYLRQGQITSNNIIMRSPGPSPVLLRSPVPTLTSPLRSPAHYMTPSPSPSIPPSPSPSPSHVSQTFSSLGSLDIPTATLVGSNNFPLNIHAGNANKGKTIKRVITKSGKPAYQQVTCNNVHKNIGKTTSPNSQARSPVASPSNHLHIQSSNSQPLVQQTYQQVPVQVNSNNQLVQIIQGSQIIESRQQMIVPSTTQSQNSLAGVKQKQQQILPKPSNVVQPSSSNTQTKVTKTNTNTAPQSSGQIILPGNINNQPLLLNQMPVLVQQNSAQGVQLILRPPVASNTPGLLIHNARQQPQMHQPQQLLRILNGMQISAPTFIVSSQQNMQQNISLQHNNQANIAQGQLKSQNVQQPQRQILNSHIISQNVSSISNTNLQAQLQNIQLNGNLAHIQVPNGLNGQFIGQIPAQFQTNLAGLSSISTNINDLQYNNVEMQSNKAASNLSNLITVPTVMQPSVVVSTASINKVGTMLDTERGAEIKSINEGEKTSRDVIDTKTNSKAKKTKKPKKAKGKLDLANLMKLSGIIEDDEINFLDSNTANSPANIPNEQQQVIVQIAPQGNVTGQDPDSTLTLKGSDEVPMIITMPTNHSEENNTLTNLANVTQSNPKQNKFPCMIMIQNPVDLQDNSEYKVSLPNLMTNVTESVKDCDISNDEMNTANLCKVNNSATMNLCASNFANSSMGTAVNAPTLQSQINEIQNHLMGFTQAVNKTPNNKNKLSKILINKNSDSTDVRNHEIDGINVHANIPSQIGNIQISQVNIPVSVKNSETVVNRNVENHIQIMPIIDNSSIGAPVNKLVNSYLTRQMPAHNSFQRSDSLIGLSASDGFVGGLSLSLSEDGRIVLRQDNRASVSDLQSQVLLRNLISSGSGTSNTNLTISQAQPVFLSTLSNINNDEFKQKSVTNCVNSVTPIATPRANIQSLTESHQQVITSQPQNIINPRQYFTDNDLSKTKLNQTQHSMIASEFSENVPKTIIAPVTKLIELPKIGPNQQLFSLNTATDQITKLNPKLTTLALTPTEQLLIVPAGINAEQLAQCLLQGQIHFNDITGIVSSNNSPVLNQTQAMGTCDDSTNKEIQISKTDEYKNNHKNNYKSSLTATNMNINNKHIQVGTVDSMISHKVGIVNNSNLPHSSQVPPLVNVSVHNIPKTVEVPKQNPSSCMPRLIPILSDGVNQSQNQNPPNFVPRIQTIQLTPQKQQLLKSVQLQIQALSAKLQNKNSLANLCIPVLDTASNTATAVIQPNLSLSDCEIHLELQNLFIEQQKILATGKVIPTIPGQHANFQIPDNGSKPSCSQGAVSVMQTETTINNTNINKKDIKTKVSEIKPTKVPEPIVTSTTPAVIQSKSITSQNATQDISKNNMKISSTPYTMQMAVQTSNAPCNTNAKVELQQSNIRIIKQPISRSSLFEQQLSVDQAGAINPDVHTRFMSKSDSCKRLIRYHCLNTPDETESDVSEEIFELRGRHFLNKFQGMINKYQQLLMKESMRTAPTSELMMIDRMFVAEEQRELERVRRGGTCNMSETTKIKSSLDAKPDSLNSKIIANNESEKSSDSKIIKSEVESTSDFGIYKENQHAVVKNENIDTFDIESEILPSFILKKCEKSSKSENKGTNITDSPDFVSHYESIEREKAFAKVQPSAPIKSNEESKIKDDCKTEPYDEWFCIQKELGYIDDKRSTRKTPDTLDMQMNDIFQSKSNLMTNTFYDTSNKNEISDVENNTTAQSKIEDIFKEDSKLFAGMSVETKLEALFSGTNQTNVEKSLTCEELTLQNDRNINRNFLMGSSVNSPKRPWNGEINYPKRQCVNNDDSRKIESENITTSYQCDNSKRLWNGEVAPTDSKKAKSDNTYQKPKKNILHDLERDLLGLDNIENNINSNFDEDINAQVQSAIDSILNLQSADATCQFMMSSESCSYESRDHQAPNNKKFQKSQQNVHRASNLDTGLDEAVKSILKS